MGAVRMRSAFKFAADVAAGTLTRPSRSIRSPWAADIRSTIVWSDLFGFDDLPATRGDAMRVASIVKARALICGTLGRQPLAKWRKDERLPSDAWMYRTSTDVPPQVRMSWTLDDTLFGGVSLWALDRSPRTDAILDAVRVPPEWWEITPDLDILVNGRKVSEGEVCLFEGPQDGLLEIARDNIRAARAMTRAWANRVDSPVPLVELHDTDETPMHQTEVDRYVDAWEDARRRGGTAYTPKRIETKVHGQTPTDLFIEGRNAERLDVANFTSMPASLLEGSTATASLTYSTSTDDRNELVDLSLLYWATPIEARLSQDDIVPMGQRVAFDLSYLSAPTQPAQGGPVLED